MRFLEIITNISEYILISDFNLENCLVIKYRFPLTDWRRERRESLRKTFVFIRQHRQFSGLINSLCFSHSFEFSGTRSPLRFS